jgi:hypothetical protein
MLFGSTFQYLIFKKKDEEYTPLMFGATKFLGGGSQDDIRGDMEKVMH